MPDIDERFDRVEHRIDRLSERIDEQSARMEQQLAQVDQRFAQVDQRFAQVDERFAQVDQRFAQVDGRFDALTAEVQKLHVLWEENSAQIKLVAEVQARHGQVLQQLVDAVEPLRVFPDLFKQVAQDHERRITALERNRATG